MCVGEAAARLEAGGAALALGVALAAIAAAGLCLNAYILIVIVLTKQPATASSVLLLHLGAAGALASGATLAGAGAWRALALAALHPAQLWTVAGLHADRCAAIAAPLHYAALVSPKKVLISLACGWAATLVLLTPLALARPPLLYRAELAACAPDCTASPAALAYCLAYALLTLLLPAALILLCNLKILTIARYHRHRIAAAIYEVTLSAQVTVTHQRNPFAAPIGPRRPRPSALAAVLQLLGSLVLLYFPYYGVLVWRAPPAPLAALAAALLAAAPPVNGLLYGVRSKAIRRSLRNYWRKKLTKSEVTQEIQARTPSACGSRRPSLTPVGVLARAPSAVGRRLSDAALGGPRLERPAPRAASCNALRAPDDGEDGEAGVRRAPQRASAIPALRPDAHVLLQRALGLEERRRRRSPLITVTRALSDERESPTRRPRAPLCRQQSRSSAALLQRGDESEAEVVGSASSASSEEGGRSLRAAGGAPEEQALLSWPRQLSTTLPTPVH